MAKADNICTQCGSKNTYKIEDPHQVVECKGDTWECRDCEESYSPDGSFDFE